MVRCGSKQPYEPPFVCTIFYIKENDMGIVLLGIIAVYAMIGILIGLVLRSNGLPSYGIGQQYGKHYMKEQGLEEEKPVRSWENQ